MVTVTTASPTPHSTTSAPTLPTSTPSTTTTEDTTTVPASTTSNSRTTPWKDNNTQNEPPLGIIIGCAIGGIVVLVIIVVIIIIVFRRKRKRDKTPPSLPKLNAHGLIQGSEVDPELHVDNHHSHSEGGVDIPHDLMNYEDPDTKPATQLVILDRQPGNRPVDIALSNDSSTGAYVEPLCYRPKSDSPPSSSACGGHKEVEQPLYIPMDVCNRIRSQIHPEEEEEEEETEYTAPDQLPPPCKPSSSGYVNLLDAHAVTVQQPSQLQQQLSGNHYQNLLPDDRQHYGNLEADMTSPHGHENKNYSCSSTSLDKMVSPETVAETLQGCLSPVVKTAPTPYPKPGKALTPKVAAKPASPGNRHTSQPGAAQAGAIKPSPKPSPKPRFKLASKSPQQSPFAQTPKAAVVSEPIESSSESEGEDYENLQDAAGRDYVNAPNKKPEPGKA